LTTSCNPRYRGGYKKQTCEALNKWQSGEGEKAKGHYLNCPTNWEFFPNNKLVRTRKGGHGMFTHYFTDKCTADDFKAKCCVPKEVTKCSDGWKKHKIPCPKRHWSDYYQVRNVGLQRARDLQFGGIAKITFYGGCCFDGSVPFGTLFSYTYESYEGDPGKRNKEFDGEKCRANSCTGWGKKDWCWIDWAFTKWGYCTNGFSNRASKYKYRFPPKMLTKAQGKKWHTHCKCKGYNKDTCNVNGLCEESNRFLTD
jgi:hypothetical protein